MLVAHFFDLIPIWVLFVGTILLLVLFIELGFSESSRDALPDAKQSLYNQQHNSKVFYKAL